MASVVQGGCMNEVGKCASSSDLWNRKDCSEELALHTDW